MLAASQYNQNKIDINLCGGNMNTQKIKQLILIAIAPALFSACTQSKFSSQLSAQSPAAIPASSTEIQAQNSGKLTCELTGKNKISIGEKVDFNLKTNIQFPYSAKYIWSGKSAGIQFVDSKTGYDYFSNGLVYSNSVQAGYHERQLTLVDGAGNTLCQTNILKIQFLGDSTADEYCAQIQGTINSNDNQLCSIESWQFFREMSARNLVQNQTQQGNYIGMADPASVYCNTVGFETNITDANGSHAKCNVDKDKLRNLLNL